MKTWRYAMAAFVCLAVTACSSDNPQAVELQKKAAATFAQAYDNPEQLDQALDLVNQALSIEPDYMPALTTRYEIRVSRREYEKALSDMEHIHQLAPKDKSIVLPRCMLMERVGHVQEARQCYTQADHTLRSFYRDEGAINADVLAATILAHDPEAERLKVRYLQQQQQFSPSQAKAAAQHIARFENGTYLQHFFP